MKISFVIPAFNESLYIRKCLASVLEQTAKLKPEEYEIIVVNNASTDDTAAIAASFPGVKVVNEPVKGLTNARHAGYLEATGDLVANIDADTILTDEWIGKVLEEFNEDPKLIALSGPFIYYDLPKMTNAFIKMWYGVGYGTYILNKYVFKSNSMLQGGNFVIRKSALDQLQGYDLNVTRFYGEDIDISRRLFPLGNVKFDLDFTIYSSGRRLEKEGTLTVGVIATLNYFWITFLNRPFREEYIDVRVQK